MAEEDSATPMPSLEVSISFGRFENDLLSWEKWSSFSQNKYLEEVEKCATPGSVAEKKAYFEARNQLIAVRKAEMLNKQVEMCQELNEENEIQNICEEVDQHDEEVIDETLCGTRLSRADINQHLELETTVFVAQEPKEKEAIEEISTNGYIADETVQRSETSSHPVVDYSTGDVTSLISESQMLNEDDLDENKHESDRKFDKYDSQNAVERVQEEPILKIELSGCETDQPSNIQNSLLVSAQTEGNNQVGGPCGKESKIIIDIPEEIEDEAILDNELSPNMLDRFKVDDVWPRESSSHIEGEHVNVKFKNTEDISALKTEKPDVEPQIPNISNGKSAITQKMKPNPQKSFKKVFPAAIKPNGAENVKRTPVSSVPRSPQILTPKLSKPSTPAVKSTSRSVPVPRVKKTSASSYAIPKSPQVPNATGSASHSATPSLKASSLSPSRKGADSISSRRKHISAGVSQKQAPKSPHMSLNFSSKVPSSTLGPTLVTVPRKSFFMEKMGDKDIVKRAFRAFQSMSTPLDSISFETDARPMQVRSQTDGKPSTPIRQPEKDGLIEVDAKSKKAKSISKSDNLTLYSKEDSRMEAKKLTGRTECKEAAKSRFLAKYKDYKETHIGDQSQSLTTRATAKPGWHKRQSLSKSFQDKDASKSGTTVK